MVNNFKKVGESPTFQNKLNTGEWRPAADKQSKPVFAVAGGVGVSIQIFEVDEAGKVTKIKHCNNMEDYEIWKTLAWSPDGQVLIGMGGKSNIIQVWEAKYIEQQKCTIF